MPRKTSFPRLHVSCHYVAGIIMLFILLPFIPVNSIRIKKSISFLWFDPPVGSRRLKGTPVWFWLAGSLVPWPMICDSKKNRQKSPKRHLRALGKSYRKPPEAPTPYFLSIAPSGCLQGRRHAQGVTDSHSMSMVWFYFLYLQKLFQRTGLLLWWMP